MQTLRNWRWGRKMGVGDYGKDMMFEIGIERQKSSRWGDEKALMGNTKRQRHGGLECGDLMKLWRSQSKSQCSIILFPEHSSSVFPLLLVAVHGSTIISNEQWDLKIIKSIPVEAAINVLPTYSWPYHYRVHLPDFLLPKGLQWYLEIRV